MRIPATVSLALLWSAANALPQGCTPLHERDISNPSPDTSDRPKDAPKRLRLPILIDLNLSYDGDHVNVTVDTIPLAACPFGNCASVDQDAELPGPDPSLDRRDLPDDKFEHETTTGHPRPYISENPEEPDWWDFYPGYNEHICDVPTHYASAGAIRMSLDRYVAAFKSPEEVVTFPPSSVVTLRCWEHKTCMLSWINVDDEPMNRTVKQLKERADTLLTHCAVNMTVSEGMYWEVAKGGFVDEDGFLTRIHGKNRWGELPKGYN
ncbi:hypothetical protein QBC47DRAFT_433245 [Echria macrotheca]|uniref:Uncharacterized protein n=1 Tax=Echria macrotheca TaxID=438768 RepID=A0AAJ0B5W4_9PEZI|nr:hypothetical protein QBC47DRAFT_433245 [Echria macrotheca]